MLCFIHPFYIERIFSKTRLKQQLKIDKTKILMTNGSLMKVESIAECSLWSILQYFDLHLAIIGLETQFFLFCGRFR